MAVIEIRNEKLSVGINTFGSELMFVNGCSGTRFLWNGDENVWSGRAPILFPICGGLKNDTYTYKEKEYTLKKHGFARNSEFSYNRINDTKAEFVLESDENTKKGFPFDFRLKIVFELCENKIVVSNIVENLSEGEMYFSIGSHEAYSCPEGIEEYEVKFNENLTLDSFTLGDNCLVSSDTLRILENSDVLPLKYEYFEIDALIFRNINFNKATLVHKNSNKKISVEFDETRNFLIWTKPNANYICFEPWNGMADVVGSNYDIAGKDSIIKLDAEKSYTWVHTIEFVE